MSDDESSQEGVDGMIGGGVVSSDQAVAHGVSGSGGGVSMQMLQAHPARKRAKLSNGGKKSISSSSKTRPVVKLMVTSVSRSYSEPWRRRQQRESSGTGFLIRWKNSDLLDGEDECKNGKVDSIRILTNAHVVRNASTVRARASFGPYVVSCDVEWVSLPLDLALLKISSGDWNEFCKGWSFGHLSTSASKATIEEVKRDEGDDKESASDIAPTATKTEEGNPGKDAEPPADARSDAPNDVAVAGEDATNDGNAKKRKPSSLSSKKNKSSDSGCLTLSAGLPKLDENVTCVGFPQGGTQISVTRGVVSRIDVDSNYVLRIQIDAAINPGNSGGPVFDERGQVVGIASSHLRAAANIGYIIPSKIVALFLQMCMDGMEVKVEDRFSGLGELVVRTENFEDEPKHVPGVPNLAIHGSQTLESKALRRHLGLEDLDVSGGVRIVGAVGSKIGRASEDAPAGSDGESNVGGNGNVKEGEETAAGNGGERLLGEDVLLAINKIPIGMDGTIQLSETRPDERINFRSLVTCQRVGSRVTLDVLRNKQRRELDVVLDMSRFLMAQYDDFDACPLYVVVGGCVFSPLTLPLVNEKKTKGQSSFSRFYREQRSGNEQVLVLSKVLNDEVNVGYHGWKSLVLKSVNGYEPTNIQDLVAVLVRKMPETIEFRCQVVGQDDANYVICMNLKDVLQSEERVLNKHMIASWCSKDAMAKELREEVEKYEPSEAKRVLCWNTMKAMRVILMRKKER
ncbi:hypothetical protein ACHAXR_007846 [Thalassiosira sp. AJA248-18]